MRALVVFESMFGNTRAVADAIASGLAETMEVDVRSVDDAPDGIAADLGLVVAGGPTHAFSMSRETTRRDAVARGADHPTTSGLRDWLERLPESRSSAAVATFDTHAAQKWIPGSAAKAAAHEARRHHLRVLSSRSFYVADMEGPLVDGETDRARAWGRDLARRVQEE
ncbi:flavodoxin/nitric oxide synthase [Microbacterium sp. ARD31]|uniref:flavodoxin family protein n=1 Tax=Microbacterium sp. ARD31 TaxID=2962576 RepID=UPI002882198E|nr:flavodoxin/nitric oxide synthase [Microbacterium sp. ARD31]MDT0183174.1 flavodoxin/nitric oxide synthase [Microbacterium sp. ARD31]